MQLKPHDPIVAMKIAARFVALETTGSMTTEEVILSARNFCNAHTWPTSDTLTRHHIIQIVDAFDNARATGALFTLTAKEA